MKRLCLAILLLLAWTTPGLPAAMPTTTHGAPKPKYGDSGPGKSKEFNAAMDAFDAATWNALNDKLSTLSVPTGFVYSNGSITFSSGYGPFSDIQASNLATAYGWGNHASAGYATLLGVSGGQTIQGGTGAGETLLLESTHHATKGLIESKDGHKFDKQAYLASMISNGDSGTSKNVDWTAGNIQSLTTTGNCTLTFTAPTGPCCLTLKIIHEASDTAYTYVWPRRLSGVRVWLRLPRIPMARLI